MSLAELLGANRRFLAESQGKVITAEPDRGLAIVTCIDTRLTELILKAFDLRRGDAVLIRNAGNTITAQDNSIVRSVAAAIYLVGVREVAVVGHTDCRMVSDVLPLLESMKKRGVGRDAFGSDDPRSFLGFLPGIEKNVRDVCEALHSSPLIPDGTPIHGLVIDSNTGEVRSLTSGVVERRGRPGGTPSGPVRLGGPEIIAEPRSDSGSPASVGPPTTPAPQSAPVEPSAVSSFATPTWSASERKPAPAWPPPPPSPSPSAAGFEEIPEARLLDEEAPARAEGGSGESPARDNLRNQALAREHVDRSAAFVKQGRLAEAEGELRTAVQLNPENATAHGNLGAVFLRQGRLEEAVQWLERAVELNPRAEMFAQALQQTRKALKWQGAAGGGGKRGRGRKSD